MHECTGSSIYAPCITALLLAYEGMIDPQVAALTYIRHVLDSTGLSASSLAKRVGIAPTTLTRPLNNPEHKFVISTSTIAKIASSTGINPAPFLESSDVSHQFNTVLKDSNERRSASRPSGRREWGSNFLIPLGVISTGEWRENDILHPTLFPPILLTHSWYKHEDMFAVAVVDNKADMVAMPGEFLICSRLSVGKELLKISGIVVVQRLANGGRLIELSACFIEERDGVCLLHQASKSGDLNQPLSVRSLDEPEGDTQVIGVVHYVVRSPTPLA